MISLTNSGWKSGLNEWVLQRLTGVYIFFYVLFTTFFIYFSSSFDYITLLNFFNLFYFKIFTILFIFSLVLHANIGVGIILTDYIKNTFIRVCFDFILNLILLSYIFFIMQILWGF